MTVQPHIDFGMNVLGCDIMSIPGLYRPVQVPLSFNVLYSIMKTSDQLFDKFLVINFIYNYFRTLSKSRLLVYITGRELMRYPSSMLHRKFVV